MTVVEYSSGMWAELEIEMNRRDALMASGIGVGLSLVGVVNAVPSDDAEPLSYGWIRSEKPELQLIFHRYELLHMPQMKDDDTLTVVFNGTEVKTRGHLRRILAAIKGK